jgi:endogenous inhibitor of DNA gyrase (YacG/DUF329 family)
MGRAEYNAVEHPCSICGNDVEFDNPSAPWCSAECGRLDAEQERDYRQTDRR